MQKFIKLSGLVPCGILIFFASWISGCTQSEAAGPESYPESSVVAHPVPSEIQGKFQNLRGERSEGFHVLGVGCVTQTVNVEGWDMKITSTAYSDFVCEGTAIGQVVVDGTFTLGQEVIGEGGVREMDLVIRSVNIVPLDASWGKILGLMATGECRTNSMPVGKTSEVSGLDCGAFGKFPDRDSVYYTTFRYSDNTFQLAKMPYERPEFVSLRDQPFRRNLELAVTYRRR